MWCNSWSIKLLFLTSGAPPGVVPQQLGTLPPSLDIYSAPFVLFRDKIERLHGAFGPLEKDWYYIHYGKQIVEKYRHKAREKFGKNFLDEEHNLGAMAPVNGRRDPGLPIFWEFVQVCVISTYYFYL